MTTRHQRDRKLAAQQGMLQLLGAATIEIAQEAAKRAFIAKIIKCMRDEKVGLEAAALKASDFINAFLEIEPIDATVGETADIRAIVRETLMTSFDAAAQHLRYAVMQARELVALADQGASS